MIINHWEQNPTQDARAYVEQMVKRRKVAFLPTKGVRTELRNYGVPDEVIQSLRHNFHGRYTFTFQVWQFDTDPSVASAPDRLKLARYIIDQLQQQSNDLADVFRHDKPPPPEPCVQTADGTGCRGSAAAPRLEVRGSIAEDNRVLRATVRLVYRSVPPPETVEQKVGPDTETTIPRRDAAALKAAAKEIVKKIHETLRAELKE